MGAKKFNNVSDCIDNGADLKISCRRCPHWITLNPWKMCEMMAHFSDGHFATRWDFWVVSKHMKCGKCGFKHPIVEPTVKSR